MAGFGKDIAVLFGLNDCHIQPFEGGCGVHRELHTPLGQLVTAAAEAGFELRLASGFRSFQRQAQIWNAKAAGQRLLLDTSGQPLVSDDLSDCEKVYAILRWSMLPGASRHHWGTDIDVYDAAAVPADYRLQLTPDEYSPDGPFGPLNAWLEQCMAQGEAFGFVRPYGVDRGGVAPEPWHLSYSPLSRVFQQQLDLELLRTQIEASDLQLKPVVLANLDSIFERFIRLPEAIYPTISD